MIIPSVAGFARVQSSEVWPLQLQNRLKCGHFSYEIFGTVASLATMNELDQLLSHVWMVRTFLKHCDEATDDEELAEVHRELYDVMLALGGPRDAGNEEEYIQMAKKKWSRLKRATELFVAIQPEVSGHMNFRMAAKSLQGAVEAFGKRLGTLSPSE